MQKPIQQHLFQTSLENKNYRWSFNNLFPLLLIVVSAIITYSLTLGTQSSYKKMKHTFDIYGLRVYESVNDFIAHSYEVFTSVFLHISITHLIFNLIMLVTLWIIATYRIYKAKTIVMTMFVAAITTGIAYQFLGNAELIAVGLSGITYSLLGLTIGGIIIHKPYAKKSTSSMLAFWYVMIFAIGFVVDSVSSIWENSKASATFIETLRTMTDASVTHIIGALTGVLIAFLLSKAQITINKNAPLKERE